MANENDYGPAPGAKPCPFCGRKDPELVTDNDEKLGFGAFVRCEGCGSSGPAVYLEDLENDAPVCEKCNQQVMPDKDDCKKEAIEQWNKRLSSNQNRKNNTT